MSKSTREKKKQTKQYLRTLTKDSKHPVRHSVRVVKYGVSGFGRNIWLSLASILVMTITLTIILITAVGNIILNETASSLRDKIDITVFFDSSTTSADLDSIAKIISSDKNVKKDTIIINDSTAETEKFLKEEQESGDEDMVKMAREDEDFLKSLIANMPATLRFKVYDTSDMASIKNLIATDETISEHLHRNTEKYSPTYDMNQAQIATINTWATIAKNGGIILGAIFLTISVLVIFNTVRMAVFSRREEIYMMKLIGSSKKFIRDPFIIEASIAGIISGALASTLGYLGIKFLSPGLSNYGINMSTINNYFNQPIILAIIFASIILIGILIGAVAARFATRKYLRKI